MSLISWNLKRSYGQKMRGIQAVDKRRERAKRKDRLLSSVASHFFLHFS
jgi:hypothetical protein